VKISRLDPTDAAAIVDCFRRVYGESYANELFYDPRRLAEEMAAGRKGSVGALGEDGRVLAHMAMTVLSGVGVVELGNTVVDPSARGHGLAWKVGAELSAWCRELGYQGYVHYPTTDHHIMQRQSVKQGFETGLMLSYIPAETDGKIRADASPGREAATIVYQPYRQGEPATVYLPAYAAEGLRAFAESIPLTRTWLAPALTASGECDAEVVVQARRRLRRLRFARVGGDVADRIRAFDDALVPCRQVDFSMADPGIGVGVQAALDCGFWFCGWLPGFGESDVFRLQKVDRAVTNMHPALVNPVAASLLELIP
jgi:GNAT superfamily N-acetyltransferase